jgi:hypothetical protein
MAIRLATSIAPILPGKKRFEELTKRLPANASVRPHKPALPVYRSIDSIEKADDR